MAHTYTSNLYHCVFSTKERRPLILAEGEQALWNYIGGIARQNGFKSPRIGGTSNHVHVLLGLPASMPIAKAMQLIKGGSSKRMNERSINRRFGWQDGYGAFSIGVSQLDATVRYIENQREHHRKRSFEEEFISFLKKHAIEYDPKYIWG
jgi:putative transposase